MRADRRRNLLHAARIAGWCADWDTLSTRPTRARTAQRTGSCQRTVSRHWRWLEQHGYLHCTGPGTTAAFRPPWRKGNLARTWTLTIPGPAGSGDAGNVTLTGVLEVQDSPSRAREDHPAPSRWPLGQSPHHRRDQLAACQALRRETLTLRRVSARMLRHLLRAFFATGYTPADILRSLDIRPDGTPHRHTDDIRCPAGWIRHRLTPWAGHPPHSAQLAHQAQVLRDRQTAERLARATARASADPAGHAARIRAALTVPGYAVRFRSRSGPPAPL